MANNLRNKLAKFYNSNKKYFDHMDRHHDAVYFESVLRLISKSGIKVDNKRLLDVGCGAGSLMKVITQKYKNAKDRQGLDISLLGKASRHLKFIRGSADDMPIKKEAFDIVFCVDVLEHVVDPIKVISECKRVLKKGGYLVIRTPNSLSPFLPLFSIKHTLKNLYGYFFKKNYGNLDVMSITPKLSMRTIGGDLDAVGFIPYTKLILELNNQGMQVVKSESWGGGPKKSSVIRFLNLLPVVKYIGSSVTLISRK